jgi:hypothetical protein
MDPNFFDLDFRSLSVRLIRVIGDASTVEDGVGDEMALVAVLACYKLPVWIPELVTHEGEVDLEGFESLFLGEGAGPSNFMADQPGLNTVIGLDTVPPVVLPGAQTPNLGAFGVWGEQGTPISSAAVSSDLAVTARETPFKAS